MIDMTRWTQFLESPFLWRRIEFRGMKGDPMGNEKHETIRDLECGTVKSCLGPLDRQALIRPPSGGANEAAAAAVQYQ